MLRSGRIFKNLEATRKSGFCVLEGFNFRNEIPEWGIGLV